MNNNGDSRIVVRNILDLSNFFERFKKQINIYISPENLIKFKNDIFNKDGSQNQKINVFLNLENKLVNIAFEKDYDISSYKNLDILQNSKKLDYSIEIS